MDLYRFLLGPTSGTSWNLGPNILDFSWYGFLPMQKPMLSFVMSEKILYTAVIADG